VQRKHYFGALFAGMWFFSKLLCVVSRLLQLKPYRRIELNVNSIRPIESIRIDLPGESIIPSSSDISTQELWNRIDQSQLLQFQLKPKLHRLNCAETRNKTETPVSARTKTVVLWCRSLVITVSLKKNLIPYIIRPEFIRLSWLALMT